MHDRGSEDSFAGPGRVRGQHCSIHHESSPSPEWQLRLVGIRLTRRMASPKPVARSIVVFRLLNAAE
jgi:hypothetical protein